jgi:Flp pilus assembly protein TadD
MTQDARSARLASLRAMLEKNPKDAFAAYGLAMELARTPATVDEALRVFRTLLEATPDYLPAYFQLGSLLARGGDTDEARAVYVAGIALAARLGDSHTGEELRAALDILSV